MPPIIDLQTVETVNYFSDFYSFISPLAWKRKCNVVEKGYTKLIFVKFQNKLLNIWHTTYDFR